MESDDVDILFADGMFGEKRLNGLGMDFGDHRLGLGQNARPVVAVPHPGGVVERLAQKRAFLVLIGVDAGRPERFDPLPVRLDQRHVDPIHRRAAH